MVRTHLSAMVRTNTSGSHVSMAWSNENIVPGHLESDPGNSGIRAMISGGIRSEPTVEQ